ncbi:MAG: hypothetical protein AAB402_00040 [Patescibacteria group bacterium]
MMIFWMLVLNAALGAAVLILWSDRQRWQGEVRRLLVEQEILTLNLQVKARKCVQLDNDLRQVSLQLRQGRDVKAVGQAVIRAHCCGQDQFADECLSLIRWGRERGEQSHSVVETVERLCHRILDSHSIDRQLESMNLPVTRDPRRTG